MVGFSKFGVILLFLGGIWAKENFSGSSGSQRFQGSKGSENSQDLQNSKKSQRTPGLNGSSAKGLLGSEGSAGSSGSQDCAWVRDENCNEFENNFDPGPTVTMNIWSWTGQKTVKVDKSKLFTDGLNCLRYDAFATPNEALNRTEPVEITIDDIVITSIESINDLKGVYGY